jgi:hypothetical protein
MRSAGRSDGSTAAIVLRLPHRDEAGVSAARDRSIVALLAVPLALLALTPGGSTPPDILLATATVDRRARTVQVRAVVSTSAERALDRAHRTTLRYRCGSERTWQLAVRGPRAEAGTTLRWRYGARLAGRRCSLAVQVEGPEGSATETIGPFRL